MLLYSAERIKCDNIDCKVFPPPFIVYLNCLVLLLYHSSSHPLYSLSVPSLFPLYSLSIPSLFPLYSLSVPSLFPLCSLSIPSLFPLCSLSVPSLFPLYSLSIPSLFPLYSLSIPFLFPLCSLSIPSLFPLYSLSIPSLFPLRSLSVPSLFPLCLSFSFYFPLVSPPHPLFTLFSLSPRFLFSSSTLPPLPFPSLLHFFPTTAFSVEVYLL